MIAKVPIDDTINGTKNLSTDEILKVASDNQNISIDELSIIIGKSRRTILREMKFLKDNGKLRRTGSSKTGHWEVVN